MSTARIEPETVDALLDAIRRFQADEDARATSLNARGTGLTGFIGIILSLVAALNRTPSDASTDPPTLITSAGLILLLIAVGFVLFGVLLPKGSKAISIDEIQKYPTYEFVSQPRMMVQGTLLRGSVRILAIERARNARKALWLKIASALVGLALLFVTLAATTEKRNDDGRRTSAAARAIP